MVLRRGERARLNLLLSDIDSDWNYQRRAERGSGHFAKAVTLILLIRRSGEAHCTYIGRLNLSLIGRIWRIHLWK